MSFPVHPIKPILAALAVCVLIATASNTAMAQIQPQTGLGKSIIRGVVTYADTGRPLRYAVVAMVANDGRTWTTGAVTDMRGRFELPNVPAGRFILFVNAPGILSPKSFGRTVGSLVAQLRLNEARDLFTEVVVNGTDDVDVKLQAVRGGVITGRVVDEDDQPVPGASVKLLKRENDRWIPLEPTWRATERQKNELMTDPSGVYRIAGLHPGDYIVRVSEPSTGFDGRTPDEEAYGNGSHMVVYHPAATTIKEAQIVSVVEGNESTGVDLRIPNRAPRTISGTVTFGPDNQPAGWAEVLLERSDEIGFLDEVMDISTRSDDNGKWTIRGVPAGEYVIRIGGSVVDGSHHHVNLAPKQVRISVTNADIVLETNVSESASVDGRVKIEGPAPESLYELTPGVVLAGDNSERPRNDQGRMSTRNYRNSYVRENTFRIGSLAAGRYWFVMSGFQADKYYVKSVTRKGVDISERPFKLEAGAVFDDILVTLATDLARIEGQLSEITSKVSPAEVVVVIAPANDATRRFSPGLVTAHPDAKGRFVFACGPGEYFIAAFTPAQRAKFTMPITEDYFKKDDQKFVRVKVKAGEKLKVVTLPLGVN